MAEKMEIFDLDWGNIHWREGIFQEYEPFIEYVPASQRVQFVFPAIGIHPLRDNRFSKNWG
jgi:hypothetical protein